jgi:hypothetical protein
MRRAKVALAEEAHALCVCVRAQRCSAVEESSAEHGTRWPLGVRVGERASIAR